MSFTFKKKKRIFHTFVFSHSGMHTLQRSALFLACYCFLPITLFAATYYVDPMGSDLCRGNSRETPFKTIFPALQMIQPGDTVQFKGGKHYYATPITISASGTPDKRICFMAYPGETAAFDFTKCFQDSGPGVRAIGSYGDYVDKVYENNSGKGFQLEGDNNRFIRCVFRRNGNSGLQIDEGADNNQIINCDAYFNGTKDPEDGDGFCPKLDVGSGNKFTGCRAWQNADDGWDGYLKSDRTVTTYLENCWAFKNGYFEDGSVSGGNGNGFKYGSEEGNHNQTLKNCLAFLNLSKGFDQNHDRGTIVLLNCTSFDNHRYNYCGYDRPNSGHSYTVKNCISLRINFFHKDTLGPFVIQSHNSWLDGLNATASDFESIDTTDVTGKRKSDGSLPDLPFLRLAQGSDLIDAGVDVGIPFNGRAPDLGCYESPYVTGIGNIDNKAFGAPFWRLFFTKGSIAIKLSLSTDAYIDIAVFNVAGKKIVEMTHKCVNKDETIPVLDMQKANAGVYLCSVKSNGVVSTQKVIRN